MGAFFVLILESSVCLALFYLLYKLALSKDTFHRFNRVVLLSMLLLSVTIPFGAMLLEDAFRPPVRLETAFSGTVQVMGFVQEETPVKPYPTAWALILLVYAIGVLFFLGRMVRNWLVLAMLLRTCTVVKLERRIRLYTHQRAIAPFSWMRSIVVSEKDLTDNKDIILTHETAHIGLGHSWDLLVVDACIVLQWFNPAAWLLRQELQAVHEFEADDKVLRMGIDAKKYQLLIIEKAVGTRLYSMANSLNHGSLKKRITMMLKEKSSPWARAKYAIVLPLAAVALVGFARPEFTNLQARSAGEIDEMLSLTAAPSPSVAEDKSSGNSENPTPVTEKKLEDAKPLIVLDGKLIQPSVVADINFRTAMQDDYAKALNIDPASIKEISVFKGDAAVALYGENGRNGVLVITTNKDKDQKSQLVENQTVNGVVVNAADKSPVVGANILEFGADSRVLTATKSRSDGRFSLVIKRSDSRLVVSHLSYENVRIPIQKDLTISLTPKKIMLEETVVKGFQKVDPNQAPEKTNKESDLMIEQMPQYPGGDAALMAYIKTNMRYPANAIEKGIQGKVVCSFVVDASGRVSDIKVMKSVDPSLDAEAVRVISGMPNWIPGKQNGVECAVQYAMPIAFSLEQYSVTAKKK